MLLLLFSLTSNEWGNFEGWGKGFFNVKIVYVGRGK